MGPGLALLLLGGPALSPAEALELTWDAPVECPDRATLQARTHARLGASAARPAKIRGDVRSSPSGYALRLEIAVEGVAQVTRELDAPACDELVDAAALIVAVALDPVFAASDPVIARAVEPPLVRDAPPRREPVVTPSTARTRSEPPPPRPRGLRALGIALRPSAGAWFGALPRTAATIGFDVVFPARRDVRGELGVLAIPQQRAVVDSDAGARLWLVTAVLRACFAPAVKRVRPMGCGGLATGAIGGRGEGSVVPKAASQLWLSAAGAAGVSVALTRTVELFARGEGHIHLVRPGFHLDGVGPVHQVGATSVVALAGLQVVLP